MNIFDPLKRKVFDVVTDVMGYDSVWISGSNTFTARVGYKYPSEKEELSGIESWNPDQPYMEYRRGFFIGLKESVDTGAKQFVTIMHKNEPSNIIGYFAVSEVKSKHDGDVLVARLIKI